MKPVHPSAALPDSQLVVFAKDQPQYVPLPAFVDKDGVTLTEWELTAEELAALLNGGRIRLFIYTFGQPLQPVALEAVEVPQQAVPDATGHP